MGGGSEKWGARKGRRRRGGKKGGSTTSLSHTLAPGEAAAKSAISPTYKYVYDDVCHMVYEDVYHIRI
jgi:hypothetical protein